MKKGLKEYFRQLVEASANIIELNRQDFNNRDQWWKKISKKYEFDMTLPYICDKNTGEIYFSENEKNSNIAGTINDINRIIGDLTNFKISLINNNIIDKNDLLQFKDCIGLIIDKYVQNGIA